MMNNKLPSFGQLLLLIALASRPIFGDFGLLRHVIYDVDSHYEFGLAMGQDFQLQIHDRLQKNIKLQTILLPFRKTKQGRAVYDSFFKTHNETFYNYIEELRGIADGSNESFHEVFLMNIIEEYSGAMDAYMVLNHQYPVMHCSDIVLHTKDTCIVAHNEDSGAGDRNNTAIITARINQGVWFTGYAYLGDLPSGAFGYNENQIAFTLNYVESTNIDVGGLGRGFISRDLLTAQNFSDAVNRITRPHQCSGHNYQVMDISTTRVYVIEVASFDRWEMKEITVGSEPFFHANQYQLLQIKQPAYASSFHRLRRYSKLTPPRTIDEALYILGDQKDHSYPIFHDQLSHDKGELSNWTLITMLFDLQNKVAFALHGNPRKQVVQYVIDLLNPLNIQPCPESMSCKFWQ